MKIKQYKDMIRHLTRPGTPEQRAMAAHKQRLENQKRIAKKRAEYGLPPQPVKVTDPINKNLINAHHTFDNGPFVVDHSTNELMTNEEYELREKKPNYPTEASEQQIQTLKKKLDKYKYIHGENKPKRNLRNTIVYDGSKDEHEPPKQKINEDPKSVDTSPKTKAPEPPKDDFDLKAHINAEGTKKYLEDEKKAKEIGGIVYQNFKYGH